MPNWNFVDTNTRWCCLVLTACFMVHHVWTLGPQFSVLHVSFQSALIYSCLSSQICCINQIHAGRLAILEFHWMYLVQCSPQTHNMTKCPQKAGFWSQLVIVVQSTINSSLVVVEAQVAIYGWFAELCVNKPKYKKKCHMKMRSNVVFMSPHRPASIDYSPAVRNWNLVGCTPWKLEL